ncbi:hypothetical protein BDZ97DRAFT_1778816 [Flammula alnicola]|nr:hypothetical protein BDZ97DRAFT_1778816 [Flammula alnicola]
MLTLWQRLSNLIFPFSCPFVFVTPVRPELEKIPRTPPDLPLEIWLEIFQFATYVHQNITIKPLDPFTPKHTTTNAMGANTPSLAMRTKLALVLVSKPWRRVAVQMLYEHIVIRSPARANVILQTLECSQPHQSSEVQEAKALGYGQWTRHIEVYTFSRGSGDIRYLQTLFKIFRLCPNLRMLSGRWLHNLPIEFLNGLSGLLGPSLSGLYWNEQNTALHQNATTGPAFLASFRSLRVLDLRHFIGSDPSSWPQSEPKPTLPLLQDLILSTHPRSLEVATMLCMPSLRNLTLRTPILDDESQELLKAFLIVHGQRLVTVDLPTPSADSEPDPDNAFLRRIAAHLNPDILLAPDVCPNLETLTFPVTSPPITSHIHPNLRRIGIRGANVDGLYPDKISSTRDHLMAINTDKYPRLEWIQTVGFLVEAHSDSLIKDVFIWWVERFEAMGVTLVDGEGVMWAYYPELVQEEAVLGRTGNGSLTTMLKPSSGNSKEQIQDNNKLKDEID